MIGKGGGFMSVQTDGGVFVGKSAKPEYLPLISASRSGLIAGAAGAGKAATAQSLAEGLSRRGVPVFLTDATGNLAGIAAKGAAKPFLAKRAAAIGLENYAYEGFPTLLWDVSGEQGHPFRTAIGALDPLLLSHLLELDKEQASDLEAVLRIAAGKKPPLADISDLKAAISLATGRGAISKASADALLRRISLIEEQGAERFFGKSTFDVTDFIRTGANGWGYISVLTADRLAQFPRLYAALLLGLLTRIAGTLPEIGRHEAPRLVFFFESASLLFAGASQALIERIAEATRNAHSRGVGVYYLSSSPLDVPEPIASQLSNRVQHALRAFTTNDQQGVKAAAAALRPNPFFNTERVILELDSNEALISFVESSGERAVAQRTVIRPPSSRLGPLSPDERKAIIAASPIGGKAKANGRGRDPAKARASAQAASQPREVQEERRRKSLIGRLFRSRRGG